MKDFKREERYIVIKRDDIAKIEKDYGKGFAYNSNLPTLLRAIDKMRIEENRGLLNCVVVEDDWPEYENVWDMIEKRCLNNLSG